MPLDQPLGQQKLAATQAQRKLDQEVLILLLAPEGEILARRAIAEGGVYLNNHRVASENQVLTDDDLFYDRCAFVRRGKRTVAIVEKMDD